MIGTTKRNAGAGEERQHEESDTDDQNQGSKQEEWFNSLSAFNAKRVVSRSIEKKEAKALGGGYGLQA